MTTYNVANNAALAALKSTLVDGDVLRLAPGEWTLIKIDNTWPDNLTLEAQTVGAATAIPGFSSGHPARFTRTVWVHQFHIHGSRTVTLRNIRTRLPFWPDNTLGETWESVAAAYNPEYVSKCQVYIYGPGAGDLHLEGMEGHQGIGLAGTDYDPTQEYKEYTATTNPYWLGPNGAVSDTFVDGWNQLAGHGDAHSVYNTIGNGPSFMHADGSTRTGKAYLTHCYPHDINNALGCFYGGGFVNTRNWSARPYRDNGAMGVSSALTGILAENYQNICEDMWSNSYDSSNPHSDWDQKYRQQNVGVASVLAVADIRIRNQQNLLFRRSGCRGSGPQVNFWRSGLDSSWKMLWDNACVWNNVFLTSGTPFGWKTGYIEDPDDVGNLFLHSPGSTDNTTIGITTEAPANSPRGGGFGRSENSIMEGIIANEAGTLQPFQYITSLTGVGARGVNVNYSTFLQGGDVANNTTDFGPGTPMVDIWNAYRRKPAYQHLGAPDMNIEDFILGPLTYENIRPFVGWRTALGVTPVSPITGPICRVRGEPDVDHPFTVVSGEVRILDKDRTTVLRGWSNAPGTVRAEQFMEPRHTSASSGQAKTEILLDGNSYSFRSQTASLNKYPLMDLDGTVYFQRVAGAVSPASSVGSWAAEFVFDSAAPATNTTIFRAPDTTCLQVQLLTTKALQIIMKGYSGAGVNLGEVFRSGSVALVNGHRYRVMFSWDMTKATAAEGFIGRCIDLDTNTTINLNTPTSWVGGDVTIRWDSTSTAYTMWGAAGPSNCLDGKPAMMHLQTSQFLDVSSVDIQQRFSPDFIGDDGEGVLLGGAANIFAAGKSAAWVVAGGINRGIGPKFAKQGAAAVPDIGTDVWPPAHLITLSTDAPEPYVVDIPITVRAEISGYAPSGTNLDLSSTNGASLSPDPVTLPPGTVGATFIYIPRAGGGDTLTANHSGIYENATLELDAEDPYTYIAPGASAALTEEQRATIQFRTYEDAPTTNVVIQGRYRTLADESGGLSGANYSVDIVPNE